MTAEPVRVRRDGGAVPVVRSIPDPEAVAAEVADRYAVGAVSSCHLLAHTRSDCFALESEQGGLVLRVHPVDGATREALDYEVSFLRHAASAGAAVAEPLPDRWGQLWWEMRAPEGTRRWALFRRAPGGLSGEPHPSAAFGRAAARLHAAGDSFAPGTTAPVVGPDALLVRPVAALRAFLPARRDAHDYLAGVADALAQRLEDLGPHLDVGPIHGDLHGGQGHVAENGAVTLFDFDGCGLGWRAYDLAGFRWWQRFNGRPERLWAEFLAGYREVRPIGDADLAAVPALVAVRHVWLQGLSAEMAATHGRWWADDRFFDQRLARLADWLAGVDGLDSAAWRCETTLGNPIGDGRERARRTSVPWPEPPG